MWQYLSELFFTIKKSDFGEKLDFYSIPEKGVQTLVWLSLLNDWIPAKIFI